MAGFKETPRQKMIGMMYLVLTALLALNVSVEMLDAFIVVNESMEVTNENFAKKIDQTYSNFEKQYNLNQNKVAPFWEKANQARVLSKEMIDYINNVKYEVIAQSEKITVEEAKLLTLDKVGSKDKYDESTNYFIGNTPSGKNAAAGKLRAKLETYRENLLALIDDPQVRSSMNIGLEFNDDYRSADGVKEPWERHHFYHTILAADVTILNKIVAEVQNAELDIVSNLYSSVSAEDFKFDEIGAKIIPKSGFVFEGGEYSAEVIVAAYDTKQTPVVRVLEGVDSITPANLSKARLIEGENGQVSISLDANTLGEKKFAGLVEVKGPSGEINRYHFKDSYTVAKPSLTVSATKMNVFYIGVDNPVSISAPGVAADQITPRISQGTLRREGNEWIVKLGSKAKGTTQISVDVRHEGQVLNMGKAIFRVKSVPSPIPKIANIEGGPVSKQALISSPYIIPNMPTDFDFDLDFEIVSFNFFGRKSDGDLFQRPGRGNRLSDEMKSLIQNAKRGDKIWIEDIIAKGPDGNRKLSSMILTIN